MSRRRLETITSYIAASVMLRVECLACGYTCELDPARFIAGDRSHLPKAVDQLARKMRCSRCGERGAWCGPGGTRQRSGERSI